MAKAKIALASLALPSHCKQARQSLASRSADLLLVAFMVDDPCPNREFHDWKIILSKSA